MQIKICGLTRADQAVSIAQLGADFLGFICVPQSPRYVTIPQIQAMVAAIASLDSQPLTVGVFADASHEAIQHTVQQTNLEIVQLHGQESPEFCQTLQQWLGSKPSNHKVWKAFRIRQAQDLDRIQAYLPWIDGVLLDAYHPQLLGGTGQAVDWALLRDFQLAVPWYLAGGLKPENVAAALEAAQPTGLDVSSGIERAPGDKDLTRVRTLIHNVWQQTHERQD